MGTRGAWGFRLDGTDKVTYNHFGSYPTGLGENMMNAVRTHKLADIRAAAQRIKLVKEDAKASAAQVKKYKKYGDEGVATQKLTDWYCLLRKTQFHPELYFEDKKLSHMIDNAAFLQDSLFCEWAYIINLDEMILEVYKGFNRSEQGIEPKKTGRYWNVQPNFPGGVTSGGRAYYGVALVDSIPLEQIKKMTRGDIRIKCASLEKTDENEE